MKANISALLEARGQTRRDLARYCLKTHDKRADVWIAKIMAEPHREFPMKYWDRISDFFGVGTYQLLQPGISPLTERRKQGSDRRSGRDRRVSHLTQQMRGALSPASAHITEEDIADLLRIRTLSAESRVQLRQDVDALARSEREAAARGPGRRGVETDAAGATARGVRGTRPRRTAGEKAG